MKNILLVIVDCLRFDRVTSYYMPRLYEFAKKNRFFSNYWSSSHCTDPSITHMLTGKHPDAIHLYSMMYGAKDWELPDNVETISQTARKAGYSTGFITNLGRWYKRGVEFFVDCRGWASKRMFTCAKNQVKKMTEPWFVVVHSDAMHTRYEGGSYDAAAKITDRDIADLLSIVNLESSIVIITSDHGEGLGQSGPDGKKIDQHGYGLWDFLTRVPLITNFGDGVELLAGNLSIYSAMHQAIAGIKNPCVAHWDYIFQAGATPKVFHRGIVAPDKSQLVRATTKEGHLLYSIGNLESARFDLMEAALKDHCSGFGIAYGNTEDEQIVINRLKSLGYWEDR